MIHISILCDLVYPRLCMTQPNYRKNFIEKYCDLELIDDTKYIETIEKDLIFPLFSRGKGEFLPGNIFVKKSKKRLDKWEHHLYNKTRR